MAHGRVPHFGAAARRSPARYDARMDIRPCVENVRRHVAELKRRNAEAQARARADLPRLVEAIRADGRVKRAYLFGSLAKGMFHPRGDIDIAVEGLDSRQMAKLQERLAALTAFPVDLRDLDSTPEFCELIEFYGEVLYAQP